MNDIAARWPPGSTFVAKMHWRLDAEQDIRAWAGLLAEVKQHDTDDARFLCLLTKLEYLTFSHPVETVDAELIARIEGLPGKYVFVPFEAAEGRTLFLKPGTLTGRHDYFMDRDAEKITRFLEGHGELKL